jgi:hypothetical protein
MTYLKTWFPKKEPWLPADTDDDTIYAIRALYAGNANDAQQKRAWAWIQYVSGADDMSFRPESAGGERATAFAEGKRFVGQQIRKMLDPAMTPRAKSADTQKPTKKGKLSP